MPNPIIADNKPDFARRVERLSRLCDANRIKIDSRDLVTKPSFQSNATGI